jgi:hypothetical protein
VRSRARNVLWKSVSAEMQKPTYVASPRTPLADNLPQPMTDERLANMQLCERLAGLTCIRMARCLRAFRQLPDGA